MSSYFKQFGTLQARAALAGADLRASRNDLERWTFYVTAGAITQELPSLEDVEHWVAALPSNLEGSHA